VILALDFASSMPPDGRFVQAMMVFFNESANLGRVCSLVLIVLGVIGLRLFSDARHHE
jgi:hypothetical protein